MFYVQSHSCLKVRTLSESDYKYAYEVLICVLTRTTDKSAAYTEGNEDLPTPGMRKWV